MQPGARPDPSAAAQTREAPTTGAVVAPRGAPGIEPNERRGSRGFGRERGADEPGFPPRTIPPSPVQRGTPFGEPGGGRAGAVAREVRVPGSEAPAAVERASARPAVVAPVAPQAPRAIEPTRPVEPQRPVVVNRPQVEAATPAPTARPPEPGQRQGIPEQRMARPDSQQGREQRREERREERREQQQERQR